MTEDRKRKNEIFDAPSAQDQMLRAGPVEAGGMRFDVPVVEVPLPSNGMVYPTDCPIHGKESILIDAMTTKQENILTNRSLAKQGTLLTHLISSVIKERGIDPRTMLTGDRNTIMISLRVSGYGSDYNVQLKCPACGEQFNQEFQLTNMPIRRLELQPLEPGTNLFEMVLPLSKARVTFRFLTGADEEAIVVDQARRKKQGIDTAELVTQSLMHSVVSINGESDRVKVTRIINSLLAGDSRALRKFIADNEPGMQTRGWMECPNCDHSEEVELPLGATFFWPDAK